MTPTAETDKRPYFRILTADRRIKYAGTDQPSWMNFETAKRLVDYTAGEMIYEYNADLLPLWERL